ALAAAASAADLAAEAPAAAAPRAAGKSFFCQKAWRLRGKLLNLHPEMCLLRHARIHLHKVNQ
ncbi:MAG: hypothetical protein NC406_09790, partial [Bacteroides sp.]|nr:hypothetical protein [Bacteroides sp.]MCM1096158.1 hypothetical protein [Terasakiella sp.]